MLPYSPEQNEDKLLGIMTDFWNLSNINIPSINIQPMVLLWYIRINESDKSSLITRD